jgi:hypothetical protein
MQTPALLSTARTPARGSRQKPVGEIPCLPGSRHLYSEEIVATRDEEAASSGEGREEMTR